MDVKIVICEDAKAKYVCFFSLFVNFERKIYFMEKVCKNGRRMKVSIRIKSSWKLIEIKTYLRKKCNILLFFENFGCFNNFLDSSFTRSCVK